MSTAATERAADYAARHRDSPVALAASTVGAVRMLDRMVAEVEHVVGGADLRRAYGLGVLSKSGGLPPDVHQAESGLWPDVTEDEYLARWITTACDWHTSGGAESGWAAQVQPDPEEELAPAAAVCVEVPGAVLEYLLRLVHAPKLAFAGECVAAMQVGAPFPDPWHGGPEPVWAADVRRKVRKHWGRS